MVCVSGGNILWNKHKKTFDMSAVSAMNLSKAGKNEHIPKINDWLFLFKVLCRDKPHRDKRMASVTPLELSKIENINGDDNTSMKNEKDMEVGQELVPTNSEGDDEEFYEDEEDDGYETGEENEGLGDSAKLAPAVPPPLQERHRLELLVIICGGSALAFNAGFINGVTYLASNIPVTHVTGTATKAALMLGKDDTEDFTLLLALIVCFIFGSGITGSLMPHSSFHLGLEYGPLFIVGSAIFLAACLMNHFYPEEYYYFYLAAMGSGLQNAITTRYSGNIIRTTHMTGTATDIGLVFGRIVMGDWREMWKLYILVPLFVSFGVGGIFSVYAFNRLGTLSLLINVVVFFSIGLAYSFLVSLNLNIPMWKAFFGFYELTNKQIKETGEKMKQAAHHIKTHLANIKIHNPLLHHHHHHHHHSMSRRHSSSTASRRRRASSKRRSLSHSQHGSRASSRVSSRKNSPRPPHGQHHPHTHNYQMTPRIQEEEETDLLPKPLPNKGWFAWLVPATANDKKLASKMKDPGDSDDDMV